MMKKNTLKVSLTLLVGLFAISLVLMPAHAQARNIKVGVIDCYSGPPAAYGKDALNGFKLALKEMDSRKGGLLSGGEQKMLAVGRALMTNPQFLLLDEPTEGLAPVLVKTLGERIQTLKAVGLTVLLAEQNFKFTLALSDYGYIIDNGRICYQGPVDEMIDNDEVKKICGI